MKMIGTRKSRKKAVAAAALTMVLLAGCATPVEEVNEARDSWRGARYADIVARWGVPTRSTELPDGRNAHTWVSESVSGGGGTWFPSIGVFGGSRGVGVGVGTGVAIGQGGGGVMLRCERTMFFYDAQLVDQNWYGHASYCSSFRRS